MMAKKSEKAEPKKECPSCGLGVAPESSICEFCGWDFEEEDEWILQIEKLERDLMLEKQKFEPGTVNHMIEATLRNPVLERVQSSVPAKEEAIDIDEEAETAPETEPKTSRERAVKPEPSSQDDAGTRVRSIKMPPQRRETPAPSREVADVPVRKAKAPPQAEPAPTPQRRVRTVASPPAASAEEEAVPTRKVRTVRKAKQ
jgi:hypothetical protein